MSEPNSHRSTFHQYIRAGVQASLARVQAAEYIVPELDQQQAWHMLSFALDVPEVWDVARALLLALAPKMELAGYRNEWMPYLETGQKLALMHKDIRTVSQCEFYIGQLYRLQSRFGESRHWLITSLGHFAALGDTNGQARMLNELAWLDHLQHDYVEATAHAKDALGLLSENDLESGMSYRVLGMIAFEQGSWVEAEKYHEMALVIFEAQGHNRFIAWALQNIAIALAQQAKFEAAITLFEKAAKLLKRLNDLYNLAMVQMNLGLTYLRVNQIALALESTLNAFGVFQKLYDSLNLAKVNTNLGLIYYFLQDYQRATQTFKTSMHLHQGLGNKHLVLNAMDGLGMVYLASKQYDQAIRVLEEAVTALPEIISYPNYNYLYHSLTTHLIEAKQNSEVAV